MNPLSRLAHRISSSAVRNRNRLPGFVNRAIDDVAKNPDGVLSRFSSVLLGNSRPPAPTRAPETPVRVYIGPTNYSGQGYLWARSLESNFPDVGALNMAVDLPGGFTFPADTSVPVSVYNHSTRWQQAEWSAVQAFTHVLFEAERPLFGSLFDRNVGSELDQLEARGIACAFMCHGTDIRSPRKHASLTPWSPFADEPHTPLLQRDADKNLELLMSRGLPVFVSTPDLLLDVPWATWCPVVVDPGAWSDSRELFSDRVPVVTHIPSMGSTKGTHLIEPTLHLLAGEGIIEYRRATGVSAKDMPAIIGDSDIVLDQFRIGSYGVAACEAMAAGRLVVGHVVPEVRKLVQDLTGMQLPIIEATPDTLGNVLRALAQNAGDSIQRAQAGRDFVHATHTGVRSALTLRSNWIN